MPPTMKVVLAKLWCHQVSAHHIDFWNSTGGHIQCFAVYSFHLTAPDLWNLHLAHSFFLHSFAASHWHLARALDITIVMVTALELTKCVYQIDSTWDLLVTREWWSYICEASQTMIRDWSPFVYHPAFPQVRRPVSQPIHQGLSLLESCSSLFEWETTV